MSGSRARVIGPRIWNHWEELDLGRPTAIPVMAGDLVGVVTGPMLDEPRALYVVEAVGPDGAPVLSRDLLAGGVL